MNDLVKSRSRRKTISVFIVIGLMSVLVVGYFAYRLFNDTVPYTSLKPENERVFAVRFDPSYYYNPYARPAGIAENLAKKWKDAGINTVFYRAYDPKHGAFYRTGYRMNREGDFGRYGLLEQVLDVCHKSGIRVFAWFPVLNHAGAWRANPQWRTKKADGGDYRAEGLQYPLCARNPEVRRWWNGFITDFLKTYPAIDGIDFGEPIISWNADDACYCRICRAKFKTDPKRRSDIRAAALTEILENSIRRVHRFGKTAVLTTVQVAGANGDLLDFGELSAMTGLDLTALLTAENGSRPDIVCPEFLWQQLRYRHEGQTVSSGTGRAVKSVFTPEWTQKACRRFIDQLETGIRVVAHVELTDFPGVDVKSRDLQTAMEAALRAGASGIDIYSSREIDRESAWPIVKLIATRKTVSPRRCLVLYTGGGSAPVDAIQTGELLRHFSAKVTILPLQSYKKDMGRSRDVVFVIGTKLPDAIPRALKADILAGSPVVCWVGDGISMLLNDKAVSRRLGLEYVDTVENRFNHVTYKSIDLPKQSPWTHIVRPLNRRRCEVLATTAGHDESAIPYAVRCDRRFWYFADLPTAYTIEGGNYLVFADLLHDILGQDHKAKQPALVRIEDVHALSNPKALKRIADMLNAEGVPFQVAVVPIYVFPAENIRVALHERPETVKALLYMVKKGGVIVMHGVTHQRYGESTADYEFWDPVAGSAPRGETKAAIRERIEKGLAELHRCGLYPLMWETPHYAASQSFYNIINDYFSIAMERRQALDVLGTDQLFPYLITSDRFGQTIVPENLGYVPLNHQDARTMLDLAANMKVVRDGVASFFFHPFIDVKVLKTIVRTMKNNGWRFTSIRDLSITVRGPESIVTNVPGQTLSPAGEGLARDARLDFPGIPERRFPFMTGGKTGSETVGTDLSPGQLYVRQIKALPLEKTGADAPVAESAAHGKSVIITNAAGEHCRVPRPLILRNDESEPGDSVDDKSAKKWEILLGLAGVNVESIAINHFTRIPPWVNLVVAPRSVARALTDDQVSNILWALKRGDISLVADGFGALSDELGIEPVGKPTEVTRIQDVSYPGVDIRPNPSYPFRFFEAPSDASFVYTDRVSKMPMVITGAYAKGKYLFTGGDTPGNGPYGGGCYPYLLSHLFSAMNMYPMIRKNAGEIFFNPGERENISIEELVAQWRRSGIRIIHAAAWHVYPEWTYDYKRLIRLAHAGGMLVYAWFEPPWINEKFWLEHPQWREKNALGIDAVNGWRKPMALGDPDCFDAAWTEMKRMLTGYEWDGVLINRLGWESGDGIREPELYTPFSPAICDAFVKEYGVDPRRWQVLSAPDRRNMLAEFEKFRSREARKWASDLLERLNSLNAGSNSQWEMIINNDETRKNSGLDKDDMLGFRTRFGLLLVRSAGPEAQWEPPSNDYDLTRLFIAPQHFNTSFIDGAPTAYPTGTAMYERLCEMVEARHRFIIDSESSIYQVDQSMLPFIFARSVRESWDGDQMLLSSPVSSQISLPVGSEDLISIDGKPAVSINGRYAIIPEGSHRLTMKRPWPEFASIDSNARLRDFSAELFSATATKQGVMIDYSAVCHAVAVLNEKPLKVVENDIALPCEPRKAYSGWTLTLPKGRHQLEIHTRSMMSTMLSMFSLGVSRTIVAISIFAMLGLFFIGVLRKEKK
ncbi:MAG: DUF2334 domain-containing protein [Deltaproteobacteria bacterium]|nr:DUF2334 domain-containing protein [Deltaproteobacteria bacterium]